MKQVFLISLSILSLLVLTACGGNKEPVTLADAADPAGKATASGEGSDLPILGQAPNWSLAQLDGTSLDSSELAGKVVVVDFWATWCGPCRMEIPGYIEMQKTLGEEGLVIVGVSLDDKGASVVGPFAEKEGINYKMVMGTTEMVQAFGGVTVIPTTFLIDREGNVRHVKKGAMERADYEPLVRSLL